MSLHSDWPDEADVTALFETAGLAVPATADPSSALYSARMEIQRETNRSFVQVVEARRFDGKGSVTLRIDDCTDVMAIAMMSADGTSVSPLPATGWQAVSFDPRLSTAAEVKNAVRRVQGPWPYGLGNVRVTAAFGEPMMDDIWLATSERAAIAMFPPIFFFRTAGAISWAQGGPEGRDEESMFPKPFLIEYWMNHSNRILQINRRFF